MLNLFLGQEKRQILIDGTYYSVINIPTSIENSQWILSKDGYILVDTNNLYLISKDGE